jgi:hypothetical protein
LNKVALTVQANMKKDLREVYLGDISKTVGRAAGRRRPTLSGFN